MMNKTNQQPQTEKQDTQPEWDAKRDAQADYERDCSLIMDAFAVKAPFFSSFAQVKAVAKMAKMYQGRDRLEGFNKYRADHSHSCHRFIALVLLHTDMNRNLVLGAKRLVDGGFIYQEVDNAYFAKKLDIPEDTIDNLISTCRDEGYYFSKERYEYEAKEGELVFKGKKSVKRACWKVFADVMNCGVEYVRAQSHHTKNQLLLVSDKIAREADKLKRNGRERGYARVAKTQKRDRKLARQARQAKRQQEALERGLEDVKKTIDSDAVRTAKKDRSDRVNNLIMAGVGKLEAILTVNSEYPELQPYPIPK